MLGERGYPHPSVRALTTLIISKFLENAAMRRHAKPTFLLGYLQEVFMTTNNKRNPDELLVFVSRIW